jgi:hypothetical protein
LRESIADASAEVFSFEKYGDRVNRLEKLLVPFLKS